jgi:hypothetical protein
MFRPVIWYKSEAKTSLNEIAVPWLRRLLAGLSPRRPGFTPKSVHVRSMVDKVALGLSSSVFPCQHNSSGTPYSYITWGMNNRLVAGRSSEIQSHPIDMNNNNNNNVIGLHYVPNTCLASVCFFGRYVCLLQVDVCSCRVNFNSYTTLHKLYPPFYFTYCMQYGKMFEIHDADIIWDLYLQRNGIYLCRESFPSLENRNFYFSFI